MGDLSEHFNRAEFACKCGCGFDTADHHTLQILERIRSALGAPITINSGCRCPAYNASIGGATKSQHMLGRAADFTVSGITPEQVHAKAEHILGETGGLGAYRTFTHVDTRTLGPARWDNR